MKLLFQKGFANLMYRFEVRLLLDERLCPDLANIIMEFLRQDPEPALWHVEPEPSPWDPLVDLPDVCGLPLFAP